MKRLANKRQGPQPGHRGGRCKLIRRGLFGGTRARVWHVFAWTPIDLEADWVQAHVARCSRCQRRFSAYGRVQLGLSLIRSEVHSLDLLRKANVATLGVLKHSLRDAPQAEHLKSALPRPRLMERLSLLSQPILQTAACAAILLLSKVGLYSSIENAQKQGQRAVRQYYDDRLGGDMAKDVFGKA